MFRPVLVEDKQQFLRSPESKHGQKHTSPSFDDRLNEVCEALWVFQ